MMILIYYFNRVIRKLIGINKIERLITILSKICNIDLLDLSHRNIGIMKFQNFAISEEEFIIKKVIPKYVNDDNAVFFDVGSNVGNYFTLLRNYFPEVVIYAFEPNPNAFKILKNDLSNFRINIFNLGFSSTKCIETLFIPASDKTSSHASASLDFIILSYLILPRILLNVTRNIYHYIENITIKFRNIYV